MQQQPFGAEPWIHLSQHPSLTRTSSGDPSGTRALPWWLAVGPCAMRTSTCVLPKNASLGPTAYSRLPSATLTVLLHPGTGAVSNRVHFQNNPRRLAGQLQKLLVGRV